MGAFKQFLSTDVTVVPFVVNKSFSFVGSASFASSSIERLLGSDIDPLSSLSANNFITSSILSSQLYNSIKQLYYTNYIPTPSQSQAPPPIYDYNGNLLEDYTTTATNARFYNYEQNTLFQTNSIGFTSNYGYERYFPSNARIGVLSIPKNLFGDYINPSTFVYKYNTGTDDVTIYDDSEGLIYKSGSTDYVGIINYQHGTVVITSSSIVTTNFTASNNVTCSFQSSRTIYETQYKCTIRPDEFNYSLNPSLISGSTDGTPYDFVTGSYFSPYVTTIGLYNERQELLAVAKLAQPLPTSRTTDTTIIVNIDR